MALAISLDEVKKLLCCSVNLRPEALHIIGESLPNATPTVVEPYELSLTQCGVRRIVKDGTPLVVKFGTRVYSREAEVMAYVASHTSIRVPRIYGVFTELVEGETMTYIVQEQIPGVRLDHALASLTATDRDAIALQLKDIFTWLQGLAGGRTRLGPYGGGSWARTLWFKCFQYQFPMEEEDARTTRSFLTYFYEIKSVRTVLSDLSTDGFLALFDLDRAPIFSHGDLTPRNIMVHNGRISGIVDWAEAGWYPYFWDSFALSRAVFQLRLLLVPGAKEMLDAALPEFFPEATTFAGHWDVQSDFYWIL